MDYAFAPLPDQRGNPFYAIYRRMFPHRPQTRLVNQAGLTRVEDFLDHVKMAPGLPRPVGSFLIASHGNDTGWIQMEIDAVSHQDENGNPITGTTYEVLVNADNNNTIEIPDELVDDPRPEGSPVTAIFHIRGCNVGTALPFLRKFRDALGGNVEVSAPKHFDNNQEMGQGAFEYLGYNFKIIRRDAFANRNQVVAAFRDRMPGFTFIDGSAVPNANWNNWIPKNVGVGIQNKKVFVNFGQQVEGQNKIRLPVQFRHNHPAGTARYTYTVGGLAANPGNNAARLQTLRDSLNLHPDFQPGHPFPEHRRYGYASVQDFVDGFQWRFNWNPPNLVCNGRRHVYVVAPPVTNPEIIGADPPTGNLLFNYYPDNNNPAEVLEFLSNFEVTNPLLFQELFQVV